MSCGEAARAAARYSRAKSAWSTKSTFSTVHCESLTREMTARSKPHERHSSCGARSMSCAGVGAPRQPAQPLQRASRAVPGVLGAQRLGELTELDRQPAELAEPRDRPLLVHAGGEQ
jgi:hypothetical protein